ncbi:hypothetical protein [Streptomyces halobius]|uniref:Uncharacterized protein n=1 Tax=Streptomyces halobius TaxID=2879846 RepID=A0ABY4M1R0_9ACTN|nr:hypothetical protein [Streptomyces halobius]UQA91613.1 hypothetical protein K9S39_06855 [Streptomyces halobius]
MTETTPAPVESDEDWSQVEQDAQAVYPETPLNPHNHLFTISMDSRGPMIVVRANSAQEINDRFQELEDAGTTTMLASIYSHLKAEMTLAQGAGPVTPVPAPQGPPAPAPPAPNGGVNYNPQVPPPGVPGTAPAAWQNVGAPTPPAPAQQQWGNNGGGQNGNSRNGPKPRPTDWPQVYKITVPRGDDSFKNYREQNQQFFKGKIRFAGNGQYWVAGDVVQSLGNWNPVPA